MDKQPKHIQPVVCPAAQRKDKKTVHDLPCPDRKSLEDACRWHEEHIQ